MNCIGGVWGEQYGGQRMVLVLGIQLGHTFSYSQNGNGNGSDQEIEEWMRISPTLGRAPFSM